MQVIKNRSEAVKNRCKHSAEVARDLVPYEDRLAWCASPGLSRLPAHFDVDAPATLTLPRKYFDHYRKHGGVKRESRRVPYVRKLPRAVTEPRSSVEYLLPASRDPRWLLRRDISPLFSCALPLWLFCSDIYRKEVPVGDSEERVNKQRLRGLYAQKKEWRGTKLSELQEAGFGDEADFLRTWSGQLAIEDRSRALEEEMAGIRVGARRGAQTHREGRSQGSRHGERVHLATSRVTKTATDLIAHMKAPHRLGHPYGASCLT